LKPGAVDPLVIRRTRKQAELPIVNRSPEWAVFSMTA